MTLHRLALLSSAAFVLAIPQTAAAQMFSLGRNSNAAQTNVINEIPRCTQSFGTLSVAGEQDVMFQQMGLGAPVDVLRHVVRESGCFRLIERGAGLAAVQRERSLGAAGRIRTADFVIAAELANTIDADTGDRSRGLLGSLAASSGRMLLQAGVAAMTQESGAAEGMGELLNFGANIAGNQVGQALSNRSVDAIKDLQKDLAKGKEDAQIIMSIASVPLAEQVGYTRRTANKDELRRLRIRDNHFGGRIGSGYESTDEGKVVALALVRAYADLVVSLGGTGSDTPEIVLANREAIQEAETERLAEERRVTEAENREAERRERLRAEEAARLRAEARREVELEMARERARASATEAPVAIEDVPSRPVMSADPAPVDTEAPARPAAAVTSGSVGQSLEIARTAVLRDAPLGTATAPVQAGALVTSTGQETDEWVQVRTSDGSTGWILKDRVK